MHFNSSSFGVRLIVANNFFVGQTIWDIYYIVNMAWRQCKPDSDKSLSIDNELWRRGTFWRLFNRHTMTHNSSSFIARRIFDRHDRIRESLLSHRLFFILSPPSSSWDGIIYWELHFLPSFFHSTLFNNGVLHATFLYAAPDFLYDRIRDPIVIEEIARMLTQWCSP